MPLPSVTTQSLASLATQVSKLSSCFLRDFSITGISQSKSASSIARYIISAIQEGEHELLEEPVEERQEVSF